LEFKVARCCRFRNYLPQASDEIVQSGTVFSS
jgi:hypothetical protein